jgi:TRAP-type C4-dicarboxylate transport system substrate-binding protein
MKRRVAFVVMMLIAIATLFAAGVPEAASTEKLTLSFPEINADSDLACQMLVRFANTVKEQSNGRIEINVFGSSQLGTEAETMEMLRLGTVAFLRINPANLANRGIKIPEYTALGLPFLLQSVQGGLNFLYSDYGKSLGDQVLVKSDGQVRSLYNYICTPARNMFTKTLRTKLPDFKGLKIRSETSDIKIDMINCWANATPMAMSEIYTSLSTGVLDGCENTLSGMKNNNWYEQVKYVLETEHVVGASVFLVSEAIWKKFTAAEQAMIDKALKEACVWFQQETDKQIAVNKEFLISKGVKFTPCTDKQAWLDSCAALYKKYAADVKPDFVSTIQSYK